MLGNYPHKRAWSHAASSGPEALERASGSPTKVSGRSIKVEQASLPVAPLMKQAGMPVLLLWALGDRPLPFKQKSPGAWAPGLEI